MTFSDWCLRAFGIISFANGYSTHIFLPALTDTTLLYNDEMKQGGAYVINPESQPKLKGLVVPRETLNYWIQSYTSTYVSLFTDQPFEEWLNQLFAQMGVNLAQQREYKDLNNVHLIFQTEAHEAIFQQSFQAYFVEASFNQMLQTKSSQYTGSILSCLQGLYYESPIAAVKLEHADAINSQLNTLLYFKQRLSEEHSTLPMALANQLALDFYKTPTKPNEITINEALEAYTGSLNLYAELEGDNLSEEEYAAIHYAIRQLRSCNNSPKANLLDDCRYTDYLINKLYMPLLNTESGNNTIANVPGWHGQVIMQSIYCSTASLLNGPINDDNPAVRFPCFFPDQNKFSDTNELIFRGGGMRDNFVIFRLIKVGIDNEGLVITNPRKSPAYYEYYQVTHNMAKRADSIDAARQLCVGTVIKKLIPVNEHFFQLMIDPLQQPAEYQRAMEFTIRHLIMLERQLLFYADVSEELQFAIELLSEQNADNEQNEWMRLNQQKNIFSGIPYHQPLTYLAEDCLKSGHWNLRTVTSHLLHLEVGRNSPLLSLYSYVNSILGESLAARHMNFMQSHSTADCIRALDRKIAFLHRIARNSSPLPVFEHIGMRKEHDSQLMMRTISPTPSSPSSASSSKNPSPVPPPDLAPIKNLSDVPSAGVKPLSQIGFFPYIPEISKRKRLSLPKEQQRKIITSASPVDCLNQSSLRGAQGVTGVEKAIIKGTESILIHCDTSKNLLDLQKSIRALAANGSKVESVQETIILPVTHFKSICLFIGANYERIKESIPLNDHYDPSKIQIALA